MVLASLNPFGLHLYLGANNLIGRMMPGNRMIKKLVFSAILKLCDPETHNNGL